MKEYKMSEKNIIIITLVIGIILLIPAYLIQVQFKTLESLFCIIIGYIYITTLLGLSLEKIKIKY